MSSRRQFTLSNPVSNHADSGTITQSRDELLMTSTRPQALIKLLTFEYTRRRIRRQKADSPITSAPSTSGNTLVQVDLLTLLSRLHIKFRLLKRLASDNHHEHVRRFLAFCKSRGLTRREDA
ncbi:hypothetical protein KP509_11G042900 [Ceratopteris richardii]|uniref:Uncharacterized protein n=1 Tax=Ceratopteris richardii TaxID=49495 RepID=A0A8T2TQX2_CERRI|nr:hypothetical protein KP509_11G042900 [Ceratopteris richardii]